MLERKVWTSKQDQVLKYLYEVKNIKKWNIISRAMVQKFNMFGKSGKQCRERYYNHLAPNINQNIWSFDEYKCLLQLHNQMGNKWPSIAKELQGRTSNSVKNVFYGVLRKNVVNLNKFIKKNFKNKKNIKLTIIQKIIVGAQMIYRKNSKDERQIGNECLRLKNQLYNLQEYFIFQPCNFTYVNKLIDDLNFVSKKRRNTKKKQRCEKMSDSENDEGQLFFGGKSSQSIQQKQQISMKFDESESISQDNRQNFQQQQKQQIKPQKQKTYKDINLLQCQQNLQRPQNNEEEQNRIINNNVSNLQQMDKVYSLNSIDYFINDILMN